MHEGVCVRVCVREGVCVCLPVCVHACVNGGEISCHCHRIKVTLLSLSVSSEIT